MKRKVAVLGATGVVGHQFVSMLTDHPLFELVILAASGKSAGKKYSQCVEHALSDSLPDAVRNMQVDPIDALALKKSGVEIAFSALPSGIAREAEAGLAKNGLAVFSNASAHRMRQSVPILIPEVNAEHLALARVQKDEYGGFIVTDSNCTVAGLVMTLKPLLGFGITDVTVTTYQSVSGAGYPGESALDLIGNLIPYIENEEEKVEAETKKILGRLVGTKIVLAEFDINATCVRVPVGYGHFESVVLQMREKPDIKQIINAFRRFKGAPQKLKLPTAPIEPIIVRDEENRPQPLLDVAAGRPARAAGMAVSVGRIARKGRKLRFALLSHNLIRGAAGTSILNAELALRRGYI